MGRFLIAILAYEGGVQYLISHAKKRSGAFQPGLYFGHAAGTVVCPSAGQRRPCQQVVDAFHRMVLHTGSRRIQNAGVQVIIGESLTYD